MTTLLMLFIFVPILVVILLAINLLLASHSPDYEKNQPYECGFYPKFDSLFSRFNIFHFNLGLCFLMFDLELLLYFPISVSLSNVSYFGLCMALLFFLILTIGFILELSQSVIKLTDISKLNLNNQILKESNEL